MKFHAHQIKLALFKKKSALFCLLLVGLINTAYAQEKSDVSLKFDFFIEIPNGEYIKEKFDFGAGAMIGAAIYSPSIKTYFTPQIGFDFMMAREVGNDDTYRESIFFTEVGLEIAYQLVSTDDFKLLPFISFGTRKVIDRYLRANGNLVISNGSSDLEYDKLPPLFSDSGLAINFGLENRFKSDWFIRLSYELYRPTVKANLTNSYDEMDDDIFDPPTQKIDLSMIKIGFGAYFLDF